MQKNRVQLVTFISSEAPFDWGLELEHIAIPVCIYCPEDLYVHLESKPRSKIVEIIAVPLSELPGSFQRLNLLFAVAEANKQKAQQFYWLEVSFLQAYLSLSFLNTSVLADWLSTYKEDLVAFEFPETEAPVLWGGPEPKLFALKAHCQVLDDLLFSPFTNPGVIASEINSSFRKLRFKDHEPNLEIATAITEPVLHIIGDELIFFGFTPVAAIGCRSHVLIAQSKVNDFSGLFSYRFFHYTGELTILNSETVLTIDLIRKLQVKADDLVIFGAGSADLQGLEEPDFYHNAEEVVKNYVAQIAILAASLNFRAAIAEILPPLDLPGHLNEENGINLTEKTRRTQTLNMHLKEQCRIRNVTLLNFHQHLATTEGTLNPGKSDGYKYIAPEIAESLLSAFRNELIQEYLKKAIHN